LAGVSDQKFEWRSPYLAKFLTGQSKVVSDRRGGYARLSHSVTNLVEAEDDIPCGVEASNTGALVSIHLDAAFFVHIGS
jgi:hypothetical protein